MFYKKTFVIYAAFILVAASIATAEDVTAKGQVSVTLTLPYQELLQDEFYPNSTIKLTNNSLDKSFLHICNTRTDLNVHDGTICFFKL